MCIKLHLEEQTGNTIVENKKLKSLKKLFNMNDNCYGTLFQNNSLQIFKGEKLVQSYIESPE